MSISNQADLGWQFYLLDKLTVAHGKNRGVSGRPRGVKGRYKMVDPIMKEKRALKRAGKK